MSSKGNRTLGARCRFRARVIKRADAIFAEAKEARAHAEVADQPNAIWVQAGGLFRKAAKFYRAGSLGLMAKEVLQQAAYCYGRASETEQAADCEQRAGIIPTHYEESEDE